MTDATPPLEDFRDAYDADDTLWWKIGCGHHQNLFDAACEEIDRLRGAIDEVCDALHVDDDEPWEPAGGPHSADFIDGWDAALGEVWTAARAALSSRPVQPEGEQR